jgi:hypothetical protein
MPRVFVVVLLLGVYFARASDTVFDEVGSPIGLLAGSHARLRARKNRPTRPTDADGVEAAMTSILDSAERVERVVPAVGCTLVLTDRRLVLVRQGASFRPRSGIQSWPLDRGLTLRLSATRRETTRLAIQGTGRSASVFVTDEQATLARALVAEVRQRTFSQDA